MATMSYHAYMQAPLTAAMVYIAVAVATALVVIVGLHMAAAVLKGALPRPVAVLLACGCVIGVCACGVCLAGQLNV